MKLYYDSWRYLHTYDYIDKNMYCTSSWRQRVKFYFIKSTSWNVLKELKIKTNFQCSENNIVSAQAFLAKFSSCRTNKIKEKRKPKTKKESLYNIFGLYSLVYWTSIIEYRNLLKQCDYFYGFVVIRCRYESVHTKLPG